MTRRATQLLTALAPFTIAVCFGCKPATEAPQSPAPADAAAHVAGDEDALASLTPAERAAVLAQKICPVTGEALGSMGPPIKVSLGDRDVYVCCEGCIDALKENPAEFLAKLDSPAVDDGAAAAAEAGEAPAATGDEPADAGAAGATAETAGEATE